MTVSVLLPTRNRLDYLRYAIETVLRQDSPDWEIVVSDNDSEEDVAGHVAALDDHRIVYRRTERFVPVTENWANALSHSTGDLVVMLGDDDGLMPGFVSRVSELSDRFGQPDVIYSSALVCAYPGVMPDHPAGYVAPHGYATFMRDAAMPFVLAPQDARRVVRQAMAFKLRFGFNMQFSTVSRRLVEEQELEGGLYQSPFPDYYATNVAFLQARRIVVEPRPLVIIGVTPKSYGFFHENKRESEGRGFLGGADQPTAAATDDTPLPGTYINVGWLRAMEAVERRYGLRYGLRVNRRRYRMLQIAWVYEHHYFSGKVSSEDLAELERRLSAPERAMYRAAARSARRVSRMLPGRLRHALDYVYHRALGQFPNWNPSPLAEGGNRNVLDVYEAAERGSTRRAIV
jgi:glycosyltransferase involved in cell wall biosynthesis